MPLDPSFKRALHSTRWRLAAVAAAIALAATFLLGGFRQAPPKRTPQAGAGERVVSGVLAVRALRAWAGHEDPKGHPDRFGGKDFLVLEAVVENRTAASSNYYLPQDLRWLADQGDQKGSQADRIYLADDMSLLDYLHPDMPVHVFMVWKIPAGRPLSQPQRFGLYERRFLKKAYVSNESGWVQDGPGVALKLVAEERRSGAGAR